MKIQNSIKHVNGQGWIIAAAMFAFGLVSCAPDGPLTSQSEACGVFSGEALAIADARSRFNRAIVDKDITPIREVLANNVILVTGTGSDQIIGRAAQLDIWADDFIQDDPLVFQRSPTCVTISGLYPIAMERGYWLGSKMNDSENTIRGEYSAKWRKLNRGWAIESETYLTKECSGNLCPTDAGETP